MNWQCHPSATHRLFALVACCFKSKHAVLAYFSVVFKGLWLLEVRQKEVFLLVCERSVLTACLRCHFQTTSKTLLSTFYQTGARCSSMVRWVVGSILHGVDPLSYFSFQPVLHNWCNKGHGMYYPVCGMVHIKEPLLLIGKNSLCGGSGFPLSLSEWSFTICLTPYNHK